MLIPVLFTFFPFLRYVCRQPNIIDHKLHIVLVRHYKLVENEIHRSNFRIHNRGSI